MASNQLRLITSILQTSGGKDKVMRIISYGSLLLSGVARSSTNSKKLLTISGLLSSCRTVLRLFDDLPMLAYSLSYGWGTQEKSLWLRALGLLNNLCDQVFFPLEHIAWAADNKLINTSSSRWWTISLIAWALSLMFSILRSLTLLVGLMKRLREHHVQMEDPTRESSSQDSLSEKQPVSHLQTAAKTQILEVIKNVADLCNAVHWLPSGLLWGGQFSNTTVGFFGTISSVLLLRNIILQMQTNVAV
ncbi:peroxisomal membrane protein 11C-like [Asterias amurensis]|uniref:peroxisomal membrane protein 11C-like n=1 Tax=Asterias amurensis TaxID=7602 RepID=UPI003AB8C33A